MFKYTAISMNNLKALPTMLLSHKMDVLTQQTRTTFILKRKYPLGLHKKNQRPPPFKSKNFVYELVEDTNIRKSKEISMILMKDIEDIGKKGELVTMKSERAYETLLLPQLAIYATPENVEKYLNTQILEEKQNYSSPIVERTLKRLSTLYLSVVMSMDTPWVLEKWHIRTSFRKIGVYVPDEAITMPEKAISGPDMNIQNKDFYVTVTINNCEQVKVKCTIHHWTPDANKQIKLSTSIWETSGEAIFPEDQPVLDSLPKHVLLQKRKNHVTNVAELNGE